MTTIHFTMPVPTTFPPEAIYCGPPRDVEILHRGTRNGRTGVWYVQGVILHDGEAYVTREVCDTDPDKAAEKAQQRAEQWLYDNRPALHAAYTASR